MVLVVMATPGAQASFLTSVETQVDGVNGVDGASYAGSLAVSPDGAHVYTGGATKIGVFARNPTSGALTFVESQPTPCFDAVIVSGDGANVYCADHSVTVFARNATTGALTVVEAQSEGVGGVAGLGRAHSLALSPDGKHLYVGGLGSSVAPGVAVFGRNLATGALTFVGAVDSIAPTSLYQFSVAVSPDGAFVDVVDFWALHAPLVFARDSSSGLLTQVQADWTGIPVDGTVALAQSPDGSHLYSIAREASALTVSSRSSSTGALSLVEMQSGWYLGFDVLNEPTAVAVSPSGRHVYVTNRGAPPEVVPAITVFGRRWDTGALSLADIQRDGVGGVELLDGPMALVLSPDGAHLYVAASALNVFAVDTACGDGVVDAGESCDDGTANGWNQCCTSTCSLADADGDGTCDRDDGCPHVAGVTVPESMSVKKVILKSGAGGVGAHDDAIRLAAADFSTTAAFDPDSREDVHLRLVKTGAAAGQLFSTHLGNVRRDLYWRQASPSARRWRYSDRARPTLAGVKAASLKERSPGSGTYRFSLRSIDANLEQVPLDPAAEDLRVTLEIASGGVGVCFETTLATCVHTATRDVCRP